MLARSARGANPLSRRSGSPRGRPRRYTGRMKQRLVSRERIFDGDYLRVERRIVRLPSGRDAAREIVMPRDAVGVLPLHRDGTVYLVRQYRPAVERTLVEAPAGVVDPGETREEAVRRELLEEVGMRPARVRHLLDYFHAEGYSTGLLHLYLAFDLEDAGGPAPEEDEHLETVTMPFAELHRRVLAGEFMDSKTILSVLWTRRLIESGEIAIDSRPAR